MGWEKSQLLPFFHPGRVVPLEGKDSAGDLLSLGDETNRKIVLELDPTKPQNSHVVGLGGLMPRLVRPTDKGPPFRRRLSYGENEED